MSKFLIVRLGALGDIVHAIPVAAAIRRAYPSARIDWLVSAKHQELLDLVPILDRRLVINDRSDAGEGTPMLAAVRELRRTHYDVTIDLQGLIKSAAIARASGADKVIGFSRKYLREPLARLFYTSVHDPGGEGIYARSETRHVVEINLGVLGLLGIAAGTPEFPIEQAASAVARELAERTGGYALLNPGAAWPNKRWPPERLAALAVALRDRHHLMSVALWGPGERELAEAVVAQARGAAVGTPIVGIYGPTRPERNGPWLPQDETVSRADVCECHHLRRCTRARMCLLDIELDEVLHAVERRLAADHHDG